MSDTIKVNTPSKSNESSALRDFLLNIKDWSIYLLRKWYWIILFGIAGAGLGFLYANSQKPIYTATTSFVLETGGGNRFGAYSGIASMMGVNIGDNGGGLFQGENILELYKSRSMITKALLSEGEFDGSRKLLIDRFIEKNKLRAEWEKKGLNNIQFFTSNEYENPKQQFLHDSLLSGITKGISSGNLTVKLLDKRLNIILVSINSNDELFAKEFNESLVQNVNEFYLKTKTKKAIENVSILQSKSDSVRALMTGSINRAASVADATPNMNPTRQVQRIAPIQNAQASAEVNKAVLGQLLQNLEMSKIALQKETPLIQIIDEPVLPLDKEKLGKKKGIMLGGALGGFLIIGFLLIRRLIGNVLKHETV